MADELPTRSKEFTLLHLSGLFAVLALIAAVLLPPIFTPTGVREKARRANCLSNLKQIGLAMAMYADNYNGRLPMDSADPTLLGSLRLVSNIVTSAKVLQCPTDWRARPESDWGKISTNHISYSYVPNLTWQDHADSIVALDRIYSTTKGSRWPISGNHRGMGGNVLFGDGHVAWYNALPVALKDKDGKQVVLSP